MKTMKFLALALVAVGLMAAAPAIAAPNGSNMTRDFVRNATVGNGFEIMSSRIALQKSQNPEVRDFAQRMINDHSQADEDLRNTVMQSRFRMANMPNNLDAKHRNLLSKLQHVRGPAFDRMYIKAQIQGHNDAVRLFGNYARYGNNPALRDYANHTLPTLQEHQDHLRHIRM